MVSHRCAETLAYGPADGWDHESPFVCTDCIEFAHWGWNQVFTSHGGVHFEMSWRFLSGERNHPPPLFPVSQVITTTRLPTPCVSPLR